MIVIISKIERFADTPPSLLDEGHFEQYGKAKSVVRKLPPEPASFGMP